MGRRDKLRKWLVGLLTYKLPLFLWALLVPEYILACAIRQYLTAGEIEKKVPGWTRTHGFFLLMGGFQLYERPDGKLLKQEKGGIVRHWINPGKFVRILEMADVRQHKLETIIPCTTERDLKDRGKSDGIGKAIIILQTLWFVVQCIVRGYRQPPLTELEIITLAYAIMNFFIYIFWWDKPRDVGCPIRIYENVTPSRKPDKWDGGFDGILERIVMYVVGDQDRRVLLSKQRKVPTFWSSLYGDDETVFSDALLGPSILGMAFGAIHFIAWWRVFPSYAESILWRMSCIALMTVPLFSTIVCSLLAADGHGMPVKVIGITALVLLMLSAWLYVLARVATIVVAFTALRSLPSEAFLVVEWTTFIPHF